jgi:uncharacterized repeat protein (TIGR03803 family)
MKRFRGLKMACIVFMVCVATAIASSAQTLNTLHSFAGTDGAAPYAGLVQATDGNFYGTTWAGGPSNDGTVFKITLGGTYTTLHSFAGTDGSGPEGLIQGTDGNLYGTTMLGGANNDGTVFKITLGGTLTTLHSFAGTDGIWPEAGLVQATDGNFYGTTAYGGVYGGIGNGTVFKITPAGTLTTLHSFNVGDGSVPVAGLLQGTDGNLYGTTYDGGVNAPDGTVFRITLGGTLTTLHSFAGTDGSNPWAGLMQAANGNLYGTTSQGGAYSDGTVFKITPGGTLTTLHSFAGSDGSVPIAGLMQATDGNFYGSTTQGGTYNDGTVFKITQAGTLTTLHSFDVTDGDYPEGVLVQGTDGNLYGTTAGGGAYSDGTVFVLYVGLQPFTSLFSFDGTDGSWPRALMQASDGSLYGITEQGGANSSSNCPFGCGTVFRITTAGTLATLYSFCAQTNCTDGSWPEGGLVQATDGSLYGITSDGGVYGYGTVFKITTAGTLTTLHSFDTADGSYPQAALMQATDGNLYGVTGRGGAYGWGTVFKITPAGILTTLYSFCAQTNCTDGGSPGLGLTQANDGNFYGTTGYGGAYGYGTVFRITPGGALATLYSFCAETGCPDGRSANGVMQATDGNFYGTTWEGGLITSSCPLGCGTIFKMTPAGVLTTLHGFSGTDGSLPSAGLVQATDGNFYGTVGYGGAYGWGTVFKITAAGMLTTLHSFTSGLDGSYPFTGLVQVTDGNLYGTTAQGGGYYGTVFKLTLGMGPFVKAQPTSGMVGAAVIIVGTNLTGATSVRFNGTAATFTVVSGSEITTTVPAGATSGSVAVLTPSGALKSNVIFRVTPQIKTFSPTSGPVGTAVTITGVSLTQTKLVAFGGVLATQFSVNSDTQVTATVPAGAKSGKIGIATPGGTAVSATSFTVTTTE